MAFEIADRVRETTTTTGTGTINLGGAVTNFETFTANLSNGDTTYYAIVDNTNNAFEVGLGTFATGSPNTLARTTIIASSNSNSAVTLGSGTKDVFITIPASKLVVEDGSNNVAIGGTVTATAFSGSGASLTALNVSTDSTPQLGGDLDVNGNDIVTTSNADIDLAPNGTGIVVVKGNTNPGSIKLNCQVNTHGQTIVAQDHGNGVTNTLTLPAGGNQELVGTSATQTLTNKTFGDNVSFSDNNITNVGDIAVDSISPDGTDINIAVSDNSATAFTIKQGSDNYFVVDTGNSSESIAIGTGISGTAITLGHSTSEVTVADNLTVTGDLTVSGTTTTVDSTTINVQNTLKFEGSTANDHETILTTVDPTADRTISLPNQSGTLPVLAVVSDTQITSTPEELNILDGVTSTASELNILDGVTATTAELNILDGVTATTAELNIMDGVTATTAELNHVDGVTSNVQTQLDAKATKGFATAMAIAL